MKKLAFLCFAAMLFATGRPACAQSGCVNSPENPTAVLALAGTAGAAFVSLRARYRRK